MEIQNDGIRDAKERKAALDCTHSYIVQAPAGSGKTSLLIHRLLKLLAKVDKPEEILAITFTRKAAEEMRSRVVEALVSAKYDPEPEKDYEKETWQYAKEALKRDEEKGWNLLQSQGRLHLKTIDSFCSDLIRRLPTGSHFGAPLAVEPDITPLLQEAVRSLLSAVDSAAGTEDAKFKPYVDAYRNLLEWYKNERGKLINDMVHSLKERALWRHSSQQLLLPLATAPTDVIQKHKNELNRQLTTAVRLFIIAHLRDLHDHLSQSELPSEMAEFMAYAWKNLNCDKYKDKPLAQDLLYCKNDRQSFDRPDELSTKDLPYYRAIKSLIFTNEGEVRKDTGITIATIGFPSNNKEEKDKKESYKKFLGKLRDPNAKERLKDPALQQAFEVASCNTWGTARC